MVVDAHRGFFGDTTARIVCKSRTLNWKEYISRYPSKGILRTNTLTKGESVTEDLNGNAINGTDTSDTTGQTIYKVVQGAATVLRPHAIYTVIAVVSSKSIYIDQFADNVGEISSSSMGNFTPYAASGETLLARMDSQPMPFDKSNYQVRYDFFCRNGGWNETTKARKFTVKVHRLNVYDSAGADTGVDRSVKVLVPTTTTRYAKLYDSSNFSPINALLQW
uniref:Uncharacterized protein n=1 Tax=viral metagenome TaxID=1070528 RepID=A0A6M3IRQ5_9ZZZZ